MASSAFTWSVCWAQVILSPGSVILAVCLGRYFIQEQRTDVSSRCAAYI